MALSIKAASFLICFCGMECFNAGISKERFLKAMAEAYDIGEEDAADKRPKSPEPNGDQISPGK